MLLYYNYVMKTQHSILCNACGVEFFVKPSRITTAKFCSVVCADIGKVLAARNALEQRWGEPLPDLLRRLYHDDRMGIKAIAKHIGVSDHGLHDWFVEFGIERRTRSDAVANQWIGNEQRRQQQRQRAKEQPFGPTGDQHPMKNPEIRTRLSEQRKGAGNPMYNVRGPLSPFWKGGKVTYRGAGWFKAKQVVLARDGHKCRRCGSTWKIQVHHIVPYRETQDNSIDNLVTVCPPCHSYLERNPTPLSQLGN